MSTYSFQDVQATLVGPTGIVNLGYGSAVADEGISIDMAGDKNTMLIGADGEGMHSLHADKSGTITVRLLQTSPTNAKLQAMYDAQTLSSALHGQNLITVTNPASGDVTTARSCAFKKKPSINYRKDGTIMEWVFDSIKIDSLLGTYN
jgi:Protein of unknown function (DUF3277)